MVRNYILLLVTCLMASCSQIDVSGFFGSPSAPIETRYKESIEWNNTHPIVTLNIESSTYGVMACSDVHISNTTDNFGIFVDRLRNDSNFSFGIVVGDLSDGEGTLHRFYEALQYNSETQKENDTIFVTTGNHDLYFNDWEIYKSYFGTSVYYFLVKTPDAEDLFISLDSSNGTLGIGQKKWFEQLLKDKRDSYRHCIVYTHTNLFNTEGSQVGSGNMPIEETAWISNILTTYHVNMIIMGHDHWKEVFQYAGVDYVVLDALKDGFVHAGYATLTIDEKVNLDFINL